MGDKHSHMQGKSCEWNKNCNKTIQSFDGVNQMVLISLYRFVQ